MFQPNAGQLIKSPSVDTATSKGGVIVTGGGSANTLGSWTQIIDGNVHGGTHWEAMEVSLKNVSTSADFAVDIGLSSDGTNFYVIAANLRCAQRAGSGGQGNIFHLPLGFDMPNGATSGVYARCQSSSASASLDVGATIFATGLGLAPGSRIVGQQAISSFTRGVGFDAGATANTKSAYTTLIASTTDPISALALCVGPSADVSRTGTQITFAIDIALGAAASEFIIVPNYMLGMNTTTDFESVQAVYFMPCSIPVGTRVSARIACSINVAGDRTLDIMTYGLVP